MTKSNNNNPKHQWYHNGLSFACVGCGNCCSGPEEGYIFATENEIQQIANYLNITPAQLKKQYMKRIGLRYSFIEKQPSKDCIFLRETHYSNDNSKPDKDNQTDKSSRTGKYNGSDQVERPGNTGKSCGIYPVRPTQCRTWPFWKINLHSPKIWDDLKYDCPGINNGPLFSSQQIDALVEGKLRDHPQQHTTITTAMQWLTRHTSNNRIINAMNELYNQLDRRIASMNLHCANCGQCCNFDNYGHRLYITTLEMLYLTAGLNTTYTQQYTNKELLSGKPYGNTISQKLPSSCQLQNTNGCTARLHRPTGCRIFFCKGIDNNLLYELTEQTLSSLRTLHEQFNAPYYYADIRLWLQQRNMLTK